MDNHPNRRRVSGFDILFNLAPVGQHRESRLADLDTWARWHGASEAKLWQAVALHSKLDPDEIGEDDASAFEEILAFSGLSRDECADPLSELETNIERACAAAQDGSLPVVKGAEDSRSAVVSLVAFNRWARSVNLPVLVEGGSFLPRVWTDDAKGSKYWWGDYETPMLLDMFNVIYEKWRLVEDGGVFDVGMPDTAPTEDEVIDWLKKHGRSSMSETKREHVASLIRHPLAPVGRRSSRRTK